MSEKCQNRYKCKKKSSKASQNLVIRIKIEFFDLNFRGAPLNFIIPISVAKMKQ